MGKELTMKTDTMKFLEENVVKKLLNVGLGNDFLGMTPKNTNNKSKKPTNGIASNLKASGQQTKRLTRGRDNLQNGRS